ncbi:hypothetical protein CKM354_000082100 [Cercospora kikuchii]|uniref:Cell wall protein PhiA n=1 Tax=Cercospora kikuchii TaxID=84275 RepID=A0A9P3C6S5_9PEZI|nr:uncharacterized protein CKM354_000082100 [Cercospora kikuchii]GIZ37373.1 hypothetical protein CKM354_000082100 [Cercospora kikuchii]
MPFYTFLIALAASLASARPAAPNLTDFYLVTTTSRDTVSSSSLLPNVNATSLFDADGDSSDLYQLRLIAPGYGSLPRFNLVDNALHTTAYGPHGNGEYDYESTEVETGEDLAFDPTPEEGSNLSLKEGYLLAVDGECTGWTICPGARQQAVISWKGNGSGCESRFIHAVASAPY